MKRTVFGDNFDRNLVIEWLKESREEQGLSVRGLAKMVDVSHSTISRMESGKGIIHMDLYFRLTAVLNVDPAIGIELMTSAEAA